ncbi:MAG: hypothetical protein K0Q79_1043 [Flavipsychrobacter sp.]|jgi:hypothetical protein|nr:hypothetical protein [Flavipsychrobacter sp.]
MQLKRLILPLIAIFALLSAGCSEKINVAAPYKDISVVYGLLDNWDTAHYIRVQKAFLDNNKSALDMAKTYDSSFYNNLSVIIKRFNFSYKLVDTIHLNLVNLDNEGYPKQPGVFFTSPNYAYKFKGPLDPNYIYRLVITNLATGKTDSADAPILDDTQLSTFYVDALDSTLNPRLDFHSTASHKSYSLSGYYKAAVGFNYKFYTENGDSILQSNPAAIAQAIIRFNWVDSEITTGVMTPRFYDYDAGFVNVVNSTFEFEIKNTLLYGALATALKKAPTNVARLLDRCEIFVYMSTIDFLTYRNRSLVQGIGITGNEIQPIYTNIKGSSVGLYTSKGWRGGKITMTSTTVDSVKQHSMFAESNIKGTVYR